jgi:hypothetical protein
MTRRAVVERLDCVGSRWLLSYAVADGQYLWYDLPLAGRPQTHTSIRMKLSSAAAALNIMLGRELA